MTRDTGRLDSEEGQALDDESSEIQFWAIDFQKRSESSA